MESFNHFPQIGEQMHQALGKVIHKTAFDIQALAVSKAPVDTGFLRSSIYTVTSEGSTYQADPKALPEIGKPENDLTAYVAVGANYGFYVEFGTRRMSAQPYLYPAVDAARASFEEGLGRIEASLKK